MNKILVKRKKGLNDNVKASNAREKEKEVREKKCQMISTFSHAGRARYLKVIPQLSYREKLRLTDRAPCIFA